MRLFHALAVTSALLLAASAAHAGPTVNADLDLGTSTQGHSSASDGAPKTSALYTVGFAIRAGWRFDVAPVWFLPEVGAGYAVERLEPVPYSMSTPSPHVARVFAGGRVGWSGMLRSELRLEPALFGHAGAGWYGASTDGTAFDVGVSLDLRIQRHLVIGLQVGYDVVTVWHPGGTSCQPTTVVTSVGPVTEPCPTPIGMPAVADPWVSYGVHAGWLFW